jgi:tripartite-type tricarboxylate transporter receptor subunit TctC
MEAQMNRRSVVAAALGALPLASARAQQSYPDRSVRLVIPYPAGGSLDVVGRAVGPKFQELTGQPLVLDNRGGAAGTLAADHVAKSRPDGYTLILASAPQLSIAAALQPNLTYDPRADLVPVTWLVSTPFALFASAASGLTDLQAVLARGRGEPGKIPFASPGNGSLGHLALEMFAQASETQWLHTPYRGAAPAMNDMAAGTVALTFTVPASALPMVQAGRLKPIAVAAPERSPAIPEMPTFAELGYPQVECQLWLGIMAPKGTPASVIERLDSVFQTALRDSATRATLDRSGATITGGGPVDFAHMLEADYPRWSEVIRRGNIKLD